MFLLFHIAGRFVDLKIGCTGWSYAGWNGPFYPKTMDVSEHLRYYSKVFDITEINSTFYRIPTQDMTRRWFNETSTNFKFTAKLPREITHVGRLKPGPYLDQFLNSIKPLGSKMIMLVIQLPPSLSFNESKLHLEKMINHLPTNYRYAIEGRHPSWFSEEACRMLSEKNLSLVWSEVEGVNNPAPITADFVYLRLIGDRGVSSDKFGKIQKDRTDVIQKWVERLKLVKNKISFAILMANNHLEGFAPHTANKLRIHMGLKPVMWNDTKQRHLSDFDLHLA